MSPIGAPGGAGDGGMIRPPAASTIGRSRKRLMSAAISVCCARSPSVRPASARRRVASRCSLAPQSRAPARSARLREPHHAIDQHAFFGATDFGFIRAGGRLIERRLDRAVDHFAETGSDWSTAYCATMRAARSGWSMKPIVTSAAIDAGLIGSKPSPVVRGNSSRCSRSPADAAAAGRGSSSGWSALTASASR